MDMKFVYHGQQVNIHVFEHHKPRTDVTVGHIGLHEYNRMPFGIAKVPATYQRLMKEILEELHTTICYILILR